MKGSGGKEEGEDGDGGKWKGIYDVRESQGKGKAIIDTHNSCT